MAKKAAAKGTGRRRGAGTAGDPAGAAIAAAMGLAATRGWGRVSLSEVAAASGIGMSELYALYPSKQAILDGFARRVDAEVLRSVDGEPPEGEARERLFDVLMRRFDALEPHRDGLRAVLGSYACDPLALVCSAFALRRSMAAMLEAAGLSAGGLAGILRIKGLSAVYLLALRSWLADETADRAPTMAALDRALRRLAGWAAMFSRVRPAAA